MAGLIRIVPESGGIQLAGPPTPQQAETLARFIIATNRYGTIVEFGAAPEARGSQLRCQCESK